MKIAIIGGGACGLFCASLLSTYSNHFECIDIIEKENRTGKKLLQTGNGKGNISNVNVSKEGYNNPTFVENIINSYSFNSLKDFFFKKGVLLTIDEEGRVYPRSQTSNTILDVLRNDILENNKVNEVLDTEITRIENKGNKIILHGKNFEKEYDKVIIAIGSKASTNMRNSSFSYNLIKSIGHSITKIYPALTPLYVKENVSSIKGLRNKVKATLSLDKNYDAFGEVLFKEDALSGIVMFELSSYYARYIVSHGNREAKIHLDFLEEISLVDLVEVLKDIRRNLATLDAKYILNGIFQKMVAKYILDATKLDFKNRLIKDLLDEELIIIAGNIKDQIFSIDITKTQSNAQVICGGIKLDEVDCNSLRSKLDSNVYFGGEVLNIDGKCGGYNLHFAFACANTIVSDILKGE